MSDISATMTKALVFAHQRGRLFRYFDLPYSGRHPNELVNAHSEAEGWHVAGGFWSSDRAQLNEIGRPIDGIPHATIRALARRGLVIYTEWQITAYLYGEESRRCEFPVACKPGSLPDCKTL